MFDEHFPQYCASTVMRWKPTWSKQTDPSGRYEIITYKFGGGSSNANRHRAIATHVAKYDEKSDA